MLLHRFENTEERFSRMVTDESEHLKLLKFGLVRLAPGESVQEQTGELETVLVLLQGSADVCIGDTRFTGLHRRGVFLDKATAIYAPTSTSFEIVNTGTERLEVAVCQTSAPQDGAYEPFIVRPDDVWDRKVGEENWQREVHDIVVKKAEGRVHRIIVGETFNPPGNWSSFPPHKHDDYQPGVEACMEEVYHYRIDPEPGFGLQHIYTTDGSLDEAFAVRNRDTFEIPYGYHPVCAAGGYQLYYLWLMAGDQDRVMIPHDDPTHAWIRELK